MSTEAADPEAPYWPPLPPDCPLKGAAPADGVFYRLVRGDGDDWKTHAMRHGPDTFPKKVGACRWNALSVYSTLEGAQKKRREVKGFRGYSIVQFEMATTMGVVLQDKPPDTHHEWWPDDSFRPPPTGETVKEG